MYSEKTLGYIWQNYGIYSSIEYIKQKLRAVLGKIMGYIGKNYGKYYGIYLSKAMGYIIQKLRGILGLSMGYLWDIIDKFLNNRIC